MKGTKKRLNNLISIISHCPHRVDIKGIASAELVASMMYSDFSSIVDCREEHAKKYEHRCYEVCLNGGGKKHVFMKQSWENGLREGIGQELYNTLTGRAVSYICNEFLFASEFIEGRIPHKTLMRKGGNTSETYAINYGIAEEIAHSLQLGDRRVNNVILTENEDLVHIDFGAVLEREYEYGFFATEIFFPADEESYEIGRAEGRELILKNLIRNKEKVIDIFSNLTPEVVDVVSLKQLPFRDLEMHPEPYKLLQTYAINNGLFKGNEEVFKSLSPNQSKQ